MPTAVSGVEAMLHPLHSTTDKESGVILGDDVAVNDEGKTKLVKPTSNDV